MTKPMTDERRREMENLFREGGHGLCYNNVRAAGRDCLTMIDCLREENAQLQKDNDIFQTDWYHKDSRYAELVAENAKLRKVAEAGRESIDVLMDTLKALKKEDHLAMSFDAVLKAMAKLQDALRDLNEL